MNKLTPDEERRAIDRFEMSFERKGKWYYVASERGCLMHPDSIDEIGVGMTERGGATSSFVVHLVRTGLDPSDEEYAMRLEVYQDEWRALRRCSDAIRMLSWVAFESRGNPARMPSPKAFYALRQKLEHLGYKNLGTLNVGLR